MAKPALPERFSPAALYELAERHELDYGALMQAFGHIRPPDPERAAKTLDRTSESAGVGADDLARAVHAAWLGGMLAQGSDVAEERRSWDTLPERDRALDRDIARAVLLAAWPNRTPYHFNVTSDASDEYRQGLYAATAWVSAVLHTTYRGWTDANVLSVVKAAGQYVGEIEREARVQDSRSTMAKAAASEDRARALSRLTDAVNALRAAPQPAPQPFDLDAVMIAMPPGLGYREDVQAIPHYCANPEFCAELRLTGFEVGVPIRAWREHFRPHLSALQGGPVRFLGHVLRCTGWSARVVPDTPLRSTDRKVWLTFYTPDYAEKYLRSSNLAGAPR